MVIPDKKLTEKTLAGASKDVVPVGHLWHRKWILVANGKPVVNGSRQAHKDCNIFVTRLIGG